MSHRKPCQLRRIEYNKRSHAPLHNRLVPLTADNSGNTNNGTDTGPNPCDQCHQAIRDTAYILLVDKCFHVACFRCATCARPLRDLKVFRPEVSDSGATVLLCVDCYHKQFVAVQCAKCGEDIADPVTVVVSDTEKYHTRCFQCDTCALPLESSFYEHEGHRYCREHYVGLVATACAHCAQPIVPGSTDEGSDTDRKLQSTTANTARQIAFHGRTYHSQCFVCDVCGSTLDDTSANKSRKSIVSAASLPPTKDSGESLKSANEKVKLNKCFYAMDGQKLCKACAKQRHKQKKLQKKQ